MPCVPFSSRFCTRRAPAYNVRPWVSVDRRMGDYQPLREAVYMRNRRALAGPIRSGDGGGEWRYLSAASATELSFLRTPAYNTRPWISVDRQMGAFQSLPEAVRRRDRRALLASIRFCHKKYFGKRLFSCLRNGIVPPREDLPVFCRKSGA